MSEQTLRRGKRNGLMLLTTFAVIRARMEELKRAREQAERDAERPADAWRWGFVVEPGTRIIPRRNGQA
jgi:hypothetical protein